MPHVILARICNSQNALVFVDDQPPRVLKYGGWSTFCRAHRGATLFGLDVKFAQEPEEESPEGQFEERKEAAWVRSELARGNDWAWFCAKVTGRRGDDEETDYLGCCSYQSSRDWFALDGYWPDMVRTVAMALQARFIASFGTFEVI